MKIIKIEDYKRMVQVIILDSWKELYPHDISDAIKELIRNENH